MSPASYRTAPPRRSMLATHPAPRQPVMGIGDRALPNDAPRRPSWTSPTAMNHGAVPSGSLLTSTKKGPEKYSCSQDRPDHQDCDSQSDPVIGEGIRAWLARDRTISFYR